MLKIKEIEGKKLEEIINKALEELNCSKEEVYIKTEELESGLFKKNKYKVIMVSKYDVREYIKKYIKELAKHMNTTINVEVKNDETGIAVSLYTENNAALIGKDGKTLNSIQTLIRSSLQKYGFNIKIHLDISDYKAKKSKNLTYEIKKIAKEVINSGIEAKLDPMNSYERRIVHNVINDFDKLETESIGEQPNRYVVIKLKED